MAILAVALVKRIEPEEIARAAYAVELYEVAFEMAVDDGALDATQKIFLEHLLSLLGMTDVGNVFLVHGVEVAALYPAAGESGLYDSLFHHLVGVDDETVGVGDVAAEQYAGHALAGTVLDTVARIYDETTLVLKDSDGPLLAAHVEYDFLFHVARGELFLAVYFHFAAALAELVGGDVENGGVVADMVRGISAGSHYAGNLDFRHIPEEISC